jgi:hypothetical protein
MKLQIVAQNVHCRAFAALAVCLVALMAPVAGALAAPEKRAPARLISASPDAVVFRVDLEPWTVTPSPALVGTDRLEVPGFNDRGVEGEPARPARKFLVGLPPDGAWTVSWRVLETAPLGTIRLEPRPFREARRGGDLG